jgi:hypothetical protein
MSAHTEASDELEPAGRGRVRFTTQATRVLGLAGAVGFAIAIAVALLAGCAGDLKAAVSLKVVRSPDTPRDASVVIDEQYIGPLGVVAAHGVRLPVGEHRISVEKNGFFPFDQLVDADRQDILLNVKLEPVPD